MIIVVVVVKIGIPSKQDSTTFISKHIYMHIYSCLYAYIHSVFQNIYIYIYTNITNIYTTTGVLVIASMR